MDADAAKVRPAPAATGRAQRSTTTRRTRARNPAAPAGFRLPAIARGRLETLQVNVGYRCNQSCVHCHVNAGPHRTEEMGRDVAATVLAFLRAAGCGGSTSPAGRPS